MTRTQGLAAQVVMLASTTRAPPSSALMLCPVPVPIDVAQFALMQYGKCRSRVPAVNPTGLCGPACSPIVPLPVTDHKPR